ncbi:hypothetical protein OSTOST_15449 [Ostertagia ostertagi]
MDVKKILSKFKKNSERGSPSQSTSRKSDESFFVDDEYDLLFDRPTLLNRLPPRKLYCRKEQEDFSYWDDDNSQSTSSTRSLCSSSPNSNTRSGKTAQDDLPPLQPLLTQHLKKSPIFPPKLPQSRPKNFTHHLISEHPWARYVTVRERPSILSEDCVTSSLPLEVYRHIPDMGYFSYEFVQSLFPRYHQQPNSTQPLPIFELMRLQDAVDFRRHSLKIIDQLQNGTYVARQNNLPVTPSGSIATTILPIPWHSTPVLYQVVSREQTREFVFVTPPTAPHRVFGLVLEGEDTSFRPCKVAFESVPDAVIVSPRVLRSLSRTMKKDDIVLADTRVNVSTAIRFSESPASVEDQLALCKLVRPIIPSHPQEGLLPLKIFDIPRDDRDWIDDRIGRFTNYFKNPREAHHKMTSLFNVGCSALLAIEGMNDDQCTRRLTATVPSLTAFPIRFHFTLHLESEVGWTANRSVFLWIVGAASVVRVSILRTKFDPQRRTLDIQLVSSARLHRSLMQSVNEFSWKEKGTIYIDICVKLARQCVNRTVPVYPMLTKHKLFENITRNRCTRCSPSTSSSRTSRETAKCRGAQVLDAVYNNLSSYKIAGSDYMYADRTAKRISLDGKSLELGFRSGGCYPTRM